MFSRIKQRSSAGKPHCGKSPFEPLDLWRQDRHVRSSHGADFYPVLESESSRETRFPPSFIQRVADVIREIGAFGAIRRSLEIVLLSHFPGGR
jgi:hypothetical protein